MFVVIGSQHTGGHTFDLLDRCKGAAPCDASRPITSILPLQSMHQRCCRPWWTNGWSMVQSVTPISTAW